MTLPPAESAFTIPMHEPWDIDDRPHYGIGGLTDGQRLSHHFELERVIRVLYRQHTQQDSYLTDQFHRLAELPHNR